MPGQICTIALDDSLPRSRYLKDSGITVLVIFWEKARRLVIKGVGDTQHCLDGCGHKQVQGNKSYNDSDSCLWSFQQLQHRLHTYVCCSKKDCNEVSPISGNVHPEIALPGCYLKCLRLMEVLHSSLSLCWPSDSQQSYGCETRDTNNMLSFGSVSIVLAFCAVLLASFAKACQLATSSVG